MDRVTMEDSDPRSVLQLQRVGLEPTRWFADARSASLAPNSVFPARKPPALCFLTTYLFGCLCCCPLAISAGSWDAPEIVSPLELGAAPAHLATAEASYLNGLAAAAAGNPTCVDEFFAAAAQTWSLHRHEAAVDNSRANQLYRSALRQLIVAATRHGRLHPLEGLRMGDGSVTPIAYHGFPWQPSAFNALVAVGNYQTRALRRRYAATGVGLPLVVFCAGKRPFMKDWQPFAATVVLRPQLGRDASRFQLEFYDPLRVDRLSEETLATTRLARDLTAPLAYAAVTRKSTWLSDFLQPGSGSEGSGLGMIEPYQPGKVPLVFVHGLLSEPLTWADLANELRALPEIVNHFQIWAFRFATSEPFLTSAATLRHQLQAIRRTYDPQFADPALGRMVLVGHSLGGLVAKLQATYSGNELWQAAANEPLTTVRTDLATRNSLQAAFYFTPSADVSRLVFIGTPHRGSSWASRGIGRLGAALVEEPARQRARHDQLMRDNPNLFRDELQQGIPTSVDLLEPSSQILAATDRLRFRAGVRVHSIIGTGRPTWQNTPSDGVVAVESARLRAGGSEVYVDASHEQLHRRDETVREVVRILRQHLAENTCAVASATPR